MFSDEGRRLKMLVAVVIILALGLRYAWVAAHMQSGWRWCMEDPVARDGSSLVFPLWTVTAIDGPDRYRISKIIKDVPVEGDTSDLHEGATVSVVARFDAGRTLAVEQLRELHVLRKWKEGLGVLGFLCALAAAPFAFRWRSGRIEERSWRT